MSGENIKWTRSLCHELWKMVLSVLFSSTPPYMEKTLSTTECSSGYKWHTKVGVVSGFGLCHQLCLVKISYWHAHSTMSYGNWCLAFYECLQDSFHNKFRECLRIPYIFWTVTRRIESLRMLTRTLVHYNYLAVQWRHVFTWPRSHDLSINPYCNPSRDVGVEPSCCLPVVRARGGRLCVPVHTQRWRYRMGLKECWWSWRASLSHPLHRRREDKWR